MMIEVLKSKIHCARVTEANLNYMGSITIDEDLLDAANMIAGEKVYIADNNNGERFETYSKRLLLHSGQDDILAELQRDDIRQGEHSMEF
mgnify:CR=1 FL=1